MFSELLKLLTLGTRRQSSYAESSSQLKRKEKRFNSFVFPRLTRRTKIELINRSNLSKYCHQDRLSFLFSIHHDWLYTTRSARGQFTHLFVADVLRSLWTISIRSLQTRNEMWRFVRNSSRFSFLSMNFLSKVVDEIFTNVAFRICPTIVRRCQEKSPTSLVHMNTKRWEENLSLHLFNDWNNFTVRHQSLIS